MTDYSLTGASAARADELGLVNGEWFVPSIDRDRLRDLQVRTNMRASVDIAIWLTLLIGAGIWAYSTLWSWWSIPAFLVYGALYGGAADARWHECGHGTAFRSQRANDLVYYLASFMLLRGPTVWRWSHYRHHTDTIIVGRDAEILFERPPSVGRALLAFSHAQGGYAMLRRLVMHAFGNLDGDAQELVPASEHRLVVRESRVMVAVLAVVVGWSLATWSILPMMVIGLPTVYGAWLLVFFGITQHAGMRENVLDHRYSTRSVCMNPIFRFLYLNMNFHVEHHLIPTVPYRALPALHGEIGDQLAPPKPNTFAAYREIFGALARQHRDPTWEIPIDVPDVPSARRGRIDVGESCWVRHGPGTVDIGATDSLPAGAIHRVDVDDRTFVVCRLPDGTVRMLDGLCTHAAVHLSDGTMIDGQLECPKHNGRFDLMTGAPTRRPVRVALGTYQVDEIDGRLVAHTKSAHRLDDAFEAADRG